jgi:hypothetical protein
MPMISVTHPSASPTGGGSPNIAKLPMVAKRFRGSVIQPAGTIEREVLWFSMQ